MDFVELLPVSLNTTLTIGNKAKNLCVAAKIIGYSSIAKGFSIPAEYIETHNSNRIAFVTREWIDKLNIEFPLIFRSSTTVEDSSLSFAGIFESLICYKPEDIQNCIESLRSVVSSQKVQMYCKRKNVDINSIRLSVLVQEYLTVDTSGVAFTKHPLSNDDSFIYTEFLCDTTDGVESGTAQPISHIINKKSHQTNEMLELLRLAANKLETHFGYPLDVEWAFRANQLYILQVRQITV